MALLKWNVKGAISVVIDQGIGAVAAEGSTNVFPAVPTVYRLRGTLPDGSNLVIEQLIPATTGVGVAPQNYSVSLVNGVNRSIEIANLFNGPFSGAIVSGGLPGGMSLAVVGSKVVLSGTPAATGTFGAEYRITGAQGTTTVLNVGITVNSASVPVGSAPAPAPAPAPATSTLTVAPTGYSNTFTVGTAINGPISNIGGGTATAVAMIGGNAPPGVGLQISNGQIRLVGTPSTAGTYNSVWQLSGNGVNPVNFNLSLTIQASQLVVAPQGVTNPNFVTNHAYDFALSNISGGTATGLTRTSGSMPAGLNLRIVGSQIFITGNTNVDGHFTSSWTVTGSGNPTVFYLDMTVNRQTLVLTPSSYTDNALPINSVCDNAITRVSNGPLVSCDLIGGTVPPGLTFTGKGTDLLYVIGTARTAGSYTSYWRVGAGGVANPATFTLTLRVLAPATPVGNNEPGGGK